MPLGLCSTSMHLLCIISQHPAHTYLLLHALVLEPLSAAAAAAAAAAAKHTSYRCEFGTSGRCRV